MSLVGLSSDDIGLVLEYLDGTDVVRLLSVGNILLKAKIYQACRKLKVITRPLMKLPISLFHLPFLDSLHFQPNRYCTVYPWRLNGAPPLPRTPHTSITKLKMGCAQSFALLCLENGIPFLDATLPNLKTLVLTNSTMPLNEMLFEAVPRGIIKLTLFPCTALPKASTLSCKVLQNLPENLQKLRLASCTVELDEKTLDYSTVIWPAVLRHLQLSWVHPSIIYNIPPNCQKLFLSTTRNDRKAVQLPLPTDLLPVSLTSVRIISTETASKYSEHLGFKPTTFPPEMTTFDLPFDFKNTVASDWDTLPKSLTEMIGSPQFHAICPINIFLPNLKRISGFYSKDAYSDSLLQNLPQGLTTLYAYNIPLARITRLPSSLKVLLDISVRPASQMNPHKGSSVPNMIEMERLPSSLTQLELRVSPRNAKFSIADFKCLPQHLQYLGFNLGDIRNLDTLKVLPKSLKSISIEIGSFLDSTLKSDPRLFEALPTSLESLSISSSESNIAWKDWMDTMSQWTRIKSFYLNMFGTGLPSVPIDMNILKNLPSTLVDLSLPVFRSKVTPELMAQLPPKLSVLLLNSIIGDQFPLEATDECFRNLPASLIRLSIPPNTEGLTPKLFEILPSSIADFTGSSSMDEMVDQFFSKLWEGYDLAKRGFPF